MSCRVSTTSLISGACVVGHRGLGVLGSTVRSETATGAHGAGYLYNDWVAGDDAKEFRGLIVTPPSAGTFVAYENGSFDLIGAPDGAYTFVYRLFVDGVDLGTATDSAIIGTPPALAPSNTVAPTVTGSAVQGQTLTASTGTWANGVVSYAYRWLRGASAISGATGSTYELQLADVGSQIRVGVIATNATGSSTEALSLQTAVVTAGADTTPPTLTSPTGTATGATTATGTVTTNEANGTLYRLASVNATELAATVKAAALTTAVGAAGLRSASFTGLTPETAYFAHYVHADASGHDSARVSSLAFTTLAVGAVAFSGVRGTVTMRGQVHHIGGVLTGDIYTS